MIKSISITTLLLCLVYPSFVFSQTVTCDSSQVKVRVKITPDLRTDEISWQILNTAREEVASGNYRSKTVCLPKNNCYIFNLMDAGGDGMTGWLGDGKCELFVNEVKVDEVSGDYGSLHQFSFGCLEGEACLKALPISIGEFSTLFEDTWYLFTADSSGMYEINACGNSCQTGIWLYDPCPRNWSDEVIGTVAYSVSGCTEPGATLSTSLIAGKTYQVRIGDVDDNCPSSGINWSLKYKGPIQGCLDPFACNYNPSATIGDICYYPGNPLCANGPDLEIDQPGIKNSMIVETLQNADQCAVNEGCLSGYNKRYILKFTTRIWNKGDQDYFIGRTPDSPQQATAQFKWDDCHEHWHYYGYAEYLLYDINGNPVPIGFKNGFCVEDLECPNNNMYKYTCQNMGITKGCADVYDRDLDCQWIDLTDVDTGRYSFVVRVNYDRSPDALGHVETNFDNNYAQFCIKITKNELGRPSITFPGNCPVYTDCAGLPFGNAVTDCKGVCDGYAKKGDYNEDQAVNGTDVSLYMDASLHNESAVACNDLNADGLVNIADAALAQDCDIRGSNYIPPQGGYENHCQFPNIVAKWSDTAWFDLEPSTGQYIDVNLKNPTAQILAWQFGMTGLVIDSVASLNNSPTYFSDIRFNPENGNIAGLSHAESTFDYSSNPVPLVRIFFHTTTAEEICINEVQAVVNERYERITGIVGNCVVATAIQPETRALNAHLYPHPLYKQSTLIFDNPSQDPYTFNLYDITGKVVRYISDITSDHFIIEKGNLPAGLYLYVLTGKKIQTAKLIIQ